MDERSGYWCMINTSTSPDINNLEPYSLPVPIIKIFLHWTHSKSHLLPLLLWDPPRKAQQIFDGKQNPSAKHFDKIDFSTTKTNPCFYAWSHRCHCKLSSGSTKRNQLLVTHTPTYIKNMHQYGLYRKWRLKCSFVISSGYYSTYQSVAQIFFISPSWWLNFSL